MDRRSFILDASLAVAWCFQDEGGTYVENVLLQLEECEACVPQIWPLEVGNAVLAAERRARITRAAATHFLSTLQELPITVESVPPGIALSQTVAVAHDLGISVYDASYVQLAMQLGIPLATLDEGMRRAAMESGVEIFLYEYL